jgi:hypothetical protein
MKGMVDVGFDKTRLAPPMWPIAMQTTVTGFFITAIATTEVCWPNLHVEKLLQIRLFVAQELLQVVVLALPIDSQTKTSNIRE